MRADPAPPDVRLVGPALAAWAAVGLGLLTSWQVAAGLSAVAGVAAGWVFARWRQRSWAAGLLAVLVVLAGFAAATALRTHAVSTHPLTAATAGSAVYELVLTDDPRVLRGAVLPGASERVLVRGELRADAQHARLRGAVTVLAPAQGWTGLLPGQRVRVRATVAPAQRPDLSVAALTAKGAPELLGQPPIPQRAAGSLRDGLRGAAARTLGADSAGLLPALVVGDTSALPAPLQQGFRSAGLTHLSAVSGTNITIVIGAVLLLVRLLGAGPRVSAVLAGFALVGFVVLARPSPSVLRAAVMGTVTLLALITARRRQAVPALAGAVLVLLAVSPALALDVGFLLSVLATGALVLAAPGWVAAMRRRGVPAGMAELLAVPAAAQLVTAPVVAGLSGQLSLVAVLANLLAAPAVGPATVLGVLATVVLAVWEPLGVQLIRLAGAPVWWLVQVGHWAAALPGAVMKVPAGVEGALALATVTVLGLVLARSAAVRGVGVAVLVGVGLVWVPTRVVTPGWPAPGWVMVACDVGQGDAVALAAGAGRAVLVDTGLEPDAVGACLDRLGVREVPLVILTHLHADHVGGLAGVLRGRQVGAVAVGPLHLPAESLARVQAVATAARVPVVDLTAGQQLQWPALTLDVLAPRGPPPRTLGSDPGTELNEASVVLAAQTAAGRVLLSGDVELAAQAALLASGIDLRADVLKVPHHGSRFSVPEFLDAVAPRLAVISVGAGNTYGHPNPGVLARLKSAGVTVHRTDTSGDVAVAAGSEGPVVVARGDPRPPP